ncbi:MAG TPA: hypothetical protein VF101_01800 [Gaiellaceae bacterium]
MNRLEIPKERVFPLARLEARRRHLVAEAVRELDRAPAPDALDKARALFTRRGVTAARVLALSGAVAVAFVAAFAAVRLTAGGEGPSAPAVAAVRAPLVPGETWHAASRAQPVPKEIALTRRVHANRGGTEIVGGTSDQRALVEQILGRMAGNVLTRVELVPTTGDSGGVSLQTDFSGGDQLRGDWESNLLAGAFRDLSAERGLPPVVGLGPGSGPSGTRSVGDAAALQAKLRSTVAAAGATVEEVSIYSPQGLAPVVVMRAPRGQAAAFLEHRLPTVLAALGNPWLTYDGTFVEVVDQNGSFLWAAATAQRVSEGSVASRAGFEGCSPVVSWGPSPAPCPAS